MQLDRDRRFQVALERAHADWAAADPDVSAALSGCARTRAGVTVPFFGAPYLVGHPGGDVLRQQGGAQQQAHPSISILLIHYLLTADGAPPSERWVTFRELPDGLFYAQAFVGHAEGAIAEKLGRDPEQFRRAAEALGGEPLGLADASYRFQALPRVALAALLWQADDEFPAQARILFDAYAGHYLPTEDLSGLGDWLAHRLTR
jgi:hypothetical protein